jgi:hypothetical protein
MMTCLGTKPSSQPDYQRAFKGLLSFGLFLEMLLCGPYGLPIMTKYSTIVDGLGVKLSRLFGRDLLIMDMETG